MKTTLNQLFEHKALTREEAKKSLKNIAQGKHSESEIAAFLTVFLMRKINMEELAGFREALLELCIPVDFSDFNTIDLCGTGGDGKNSFNISTLASFIVAGAGEKVAKHGNYGVSSSVGSSNIMEYFGYQFTDKQGILKKQLDKAGICFLHAPLFHPAMKTVAPVRRQLKVKTFFNVLGPLVNPSFPQNQLTGVYNLELTRVYQYLLQETDKNFTVVHNLDGYDEISLTDDAKIVTRNSENIHSPKFFGFRRISAESIQGGKDLNASAEIFLTILNGAGTQEQNSVVLANAALAIQTIHPNKEIGECIQIATKSLFDKQALQSFKTLLNK